MEEKKSLVVPALVVVGIILVGGWLIKNNQSATSADVVSEVKINPGEVVKLSAATSGAYTPNVIRVKAGTKVKIEGDPETLSGGMDTVIVDGYDVSKVIAPGDNLVEFVADKKGTFKVHCANGMGNGKLIVE